MKNVLRWLISPAVIGTVGLLLLSALVWWALPLIRVGNSHPFDGLWTRL